MTCPDCHSHATKVLDSRPTEAGVRRRRQCERCRHRFTTYELAKPPAHTAQKVLA